VANTRQVGVCVFFFCFLSPTLFKGQSDTSIASLFSRARLPLGSDFPVERVNPFAGLYAAITRQDQNGLPVEGWYPEECLTIDQAVRGFTIEAAYAAFQDHEIGSISLGKWADFIIVDRDVYTVRPEDVLSTKVLATYLGGKLVYGTDFSKKSSQ